MIEVTADEIWDLESRQPEHKKTVWRGYEHSEYEKIVWRGYSINLESLQHRNILYSLPEGYSIVSMADGWDFNKYHECMWLGFNHEGEPPHNKDDINCRIEMLSSPTIIPELVLAVTSPDGKYVSHCGMWYRPGDDYAYVEPVATIPECRNMGLGKAAVLEAVKRCGKLGAKQAIVGSYQQFYYNIGFYPICTQTWWVAK